MTISKRSKMKHVLNTISSDYIGGKFENTAEGKFLILLKYLNLLIYFSASTVPKRILINHT